MARFFISYSRVDALFVQRLETALAERGHDVWVDRTGIAKGEVFERKILEAIEEADAFVSVLSPASAASPFCGREVEHAVGRNKRVLPILHQEVKPERLPQALAERNWIDFQKEEVFAAALGVLIAAATTDLEWVKAHTRLTVRSTEWERKGRDRSYLLQGSDLTDAERDLVRAGAGTEPVPTMLMQDYVLASRTDATRRQRRTLRAVGYGLLLAIGLAAYAGWQGWAARQAQKRTEEVNKIEVAARGLAVDAQAKAVEEARQARRALAAQIVERSKAALEESPERATLLAVEAIKTSRGPEPEEPRLPAAEIALRNALAKLGGRPLSGHGILINDYEISPDSRWLMMCDEEGFVHLWDLVASPPSRTTLSISTRVPSVPEGSVCPSSGAFSPDSRRLALGLVDGTILVISLPRPGVVETLSTVRRKTSGLEDKSRVVAFNGRRLVLHGPLQGQPLMLVDLGEGADSGDDRELHAVRLGEDGVQLAVSPDQRILAQAYDEGPIRVWDLDAVDPIQSVRLLPRHTGPATTLAVASGGRRVAAGFETQPVLVWTQGGDGGFAAPQSLSPTGGDLEFGPDGSWLATSDVESKESRCWRLSDDQEPSPMPPPVRPGGERAAEIIASEGHPKAAISPDGRWLATSVDGSSLRPTRVWDLETGGATDPILIGIGRRNAQASGRWLISETTDGRLELRDRSSPESLRTAVQLRVGNVPGRPWEVLQRYWGDVEIDRGDRWVFAMNHDHGYLWDLRSADGRDKPLEIDARDAATWGRFMLARDGSRLLLQAYKKDDKPGNAEWRLWDLHGPKPVEMPRTTSPMHLTEPRLTPDGRWLVGLPNPNTHPDAVPVAWPCAEAGGEARLRPLVGHKDRVSILVPSPEGRWLATGDEVGSVRLWNLWGPGDPTALVLREPGAELDGLTQLVFSPDGRWLAVKPQAAFATLYDVRAPDPASARVTLSAPWALNASVSFSLDSTRVAVPGPTSTFVYDLTAADPATRPQTLPGTSPGAFSDDASRLGSVGEGTIHFRDSSNPAASESLAIESPHVDGGYPTFLTFTADGRALVARGRTSAFVAFRTSLDELLKAAEDASSDNLAFDEWRAVYADRPYEKTFPSLPVHPSVATQASSLAGQERLEEATALFRRVQELGDPDAPADPAAEARRIAAQWCLSTAATQVKDYGMLEQAEYWLRKAKEHDPSLAIDPAREARRLAAPKMVEKGRERLGRLELDRADLLFDRASEYDPGLEVDRSSLIRSDLLPRLGDFVIQRCQRGETRRALAMLEAVRARGVEPEMPAKAWNSLCWFGSLDGLPTEVRTAGEQAVALDSRSLGYRDTRGINRALSGDLRGAIEDFEAYIKVYEGSPNGQLRKAWVDELKAGRDPFTPEILKSLR